MRRFIFVFLGIAMFFLKAPLSYAGVLYFVPETKSVGQGQEFFVDVRIDTEGAFINAAQTDLSFSNSVLEIESVDKSNSVFNFWVTEPDFSNANGTLSFIGGTTKGVSGDSLQVLRIKFKSIAAGSSDIVMSDSVITANDGKGTNILSSVKNANVLVESGVTVTNAVAEPTAPVALPQEVVRPAVTSKNLPVAPVLTVPLYPDENKWYSRQGETVVFWEVPDDVTRVAVTLDKIPNTEPATAEKSLFTGKNFGVVDEGVNYVHVQFKNNNGWGPVTHRRIAIDHTSPLSFDTKIDPIQSDNPTPSVSFTGADELSGFNYASVIVDGNNLFDTKETSFDLPVQKPGRHNLTIRVYDNAGNSTEDNVDFETLPLQSPAVDFITDKVAQDSFAYISGTATPGIFVDVSVLSDGVNIFSGSTTADASGFWRLNINQSMKIGTYSVSVSSRDDRGAISYPVENISFKVTPKVVLSLGFVDLGWFEIFIIFVSLVVGIAGIVGWYYIKESETRRAYATVAGRDVKKISDLLENNLNDIEESFNTQKRVPLALRATMKESFKKMRGNIKSMKKYLGETLEKSK